MQIARRVGLCVTGWGFPSTASSPPLPPAGYVKVRPCGLIFGDHIVARSLVRSSGLGPRYSGRRGGVRECGVKGVRHLLQAHVAMVGGPVAAVVDVRALIALAHALAWGRVDLQPALVLQQVHRPLLLLHLQARCRAKNAVIVQSAPTCSFCGENCRLRLMTLHAERLHGALGSHCWLSSQIHHSCPVAESHARGCDLATGSHAGWLEGTRGILVWF